MFKRFLLRLLFTPVRALKLKVASLRAEEIPERIHSTLAYYNYNGRRFLEGTLTVFYKESSLTPLDTFRYRDIELLKAERQILEGMIR